MVSVCDHQKHASVQGVIVNKRNRASDFSREEAICFYVASRIEGPLRTGLSNVPELNLFVKVRGTAVARGTTPASPPELTKNIS